MLLLLLFRNNLRKHTNECPADIKDIEKLEKSMEELPCTIVNLELIVKVRIGTFLSALYWEINLIYHLLGMKF